MADNLIPEPQIQATNIPTGGGAQVRFDFVAPDNTFANLSKTIASAGQTMVNFNQLEENERKARDEFRANLDQIHGLTQTGQLSDAEYMAIVDEANAKAQREGIIKAHENWSTMNANSKDRAMIIAKAYEADLNENWQDITNPDNNFATKISTTEALFFSPEDEEGNYRVLGTDFNGNPVTADTSTMSPMELVALSQAISAKRAAAELAREEVKSQRMIEARTISASTNAYNAFENYQSSKDNPATAEKADEMLFLTLRQIGKQAHNDGVEGINDILKQSLTNYVNDLIQKDDLEDPIQLKVKIARTINFMKNKFSLRDQDKKPVMFAGVGTKAYEDLTKIQTNAYKAVDELTEDNTTSQEEVIASFDAWAIKKIGETRTAEDGKVKRLTTTEREQLNGEATDELLRLIGESNVKMSLKDIDAAINEFDKIFDKIAIAPDEEAFTEKGLQLKIDASVNFYESETDLDDFATKLQKSVNKGELTSTQAFSIIGLATAKYIEDQEPESQFDNTMIKNTYTSFKNANIKRDNAENQIKEYLKNWQTKGMKFTQFLGESGISVSDDLVDALYKDNVQMVNIALKGGTVKALKFGEKKDNVLARGENLKTIKSQLTTVAGSEGAYDEIVTFLTEPRTFKKMSDMTEEEAIEFIAYQEKRKANIALVSAVLQHKNITNAPREDAEGNIANKYTNSRLRWITSIASDETYNELTTTETE